MSKRSSSITDYYNNKYPSAESQNIEALFRYSAYNPQQIERHKKLFVDGWLFHNLPCNFNDPFEFKPKLNWPEIPKGWQLEFIVYPDGEVNMDLLHPVSAVFWSEDNGHFELPIMNNGKFITATVLKNAGIPFMTTFGHAAVSEKPKSPHLKSV